MGDNLPAVNLGTGRVTLELAAGRAFTCARLDNGQVKCWGENGIGSLGVGDTIDRGGSPLEMGDNLPAVDLGAGRTALKTVAGRAHACARLDNSQVKCWGDNKFAQIGLGDNAGSRLRIGDEAGEMGDNLPAVDLGTGRTAVDLTAGAEHT